MSDEYITTKEAAESLGYTIQHTRLLIREGKLLAKKLGRDWLVVREAVATYSVAEPAADERDDAESNNAGDIE